VVGTQAGWLAHGPGSPQLTSVPVHVPFWQVSLEVHRLVSTQDVLSCFGGLEQAPVAVSQMPAMWHWSRAVQTFAVPPEHWPPLQDSPVVHALPSLHVMGLLLQLPVLKAGLQIWQLLVIDLSPDL